MGGGGLLFREPAAAARCGPRPSRRHLCGGWCYFPVSQAGRFTDVFYVPPQLRVLARRRGMRPLLSWEPPPFAQAACCGNPGAACAVGA